MVVLDAARPYLVAALHASLQLPVLLVTAQPENARKLQEQLSSWASGGESGMLFPEPDVLPYERLTSDASTEMDRVRVLSALAGCELDENSSRPPLVVASAAALMSKTASYDAFCSACCTIKLGMSREPLSLLADWAAMGYQSENIVELPGVMSRRGGIVDVWPPTSAWPVRLEFFGDTVDSIRRFDPAYPAFYR